MIKLALEFLNSHIEGVLATVDGFVGARFTK